MIITGRKGYQEDKGLTKLVKQCPNCHNNVTYKAVEFGYQHTIFFIPTYKYNKQWMVVCPICNRGYHVTKEELPKLLVEEPAK